MSAANDSKLFDDDDELLTDLNPSDYRSLVVYSRDWTVGTVLEQINEGNIKLDPEFQRRNAWNDEKRSGLIESLIVGIPVPQLVFAEDPSRRKSYVVIDGRQRLLTIAGFVDPEIKFWRTPELSSLKLRTDLDGRSYADLVSHDPDAQRELINADIRCAVIASRVNASDLLYYVFYRLNSGSVSLSTQELRQALNRGEFAQFLGRVTEEPLPLHEAMGLEQADDRYRDAEVLLRYLAFSFFIDRYRGNLKEFLDWSMAKLNTEWATYEPRVKSQIKKLNTAISLMQQVFGESGVGRRPLGNGKYDSRFNRALFEVQTYFFKQISAADLKGKEAKLQRSLDALFVSNPEFRSSVSSTTKSLEQYRIRFTLTRKVFNKVLGLRLTSPTFE